MKELAAVCAATDRVRLKPHVDVNGEVKDWCSPEVCTEVKSISGADRLTPNEDSRRK